MKDGVFLSDFSSEHFYKIPAVSKADAGTYQCYAKNSVGTIVSEDIPVKVAREYKRRNPESGFQKVENSKNAGRRRWGILDIHPRTSVYFEFHFFENRTLEGKALKYYIPLYVIRGWILYQNCT